MFRKRTDPHAEFSDYFEEEPRPSRRPSTPAPARPSHGWWMGHVAGWLVVMLVALLAVRLTAGQPMFEKTLKALVAPVGFVWMVLFLVTWLSLVRRQTGLAGVALFAWVLLTVAGNSVVAQWLGESLQRPYVTFDVEQAAPVQTLLLLGGGTATTPAGNAQGGGAADRVIVAARMVLSGKAGTVVCTGTNSLGATNNGVLPAAEESRQLLMALHVPESQLATIGGRNTREELQQFAAWLDEEPGRTNDTIGIVTSAWHMSRALRLADHFGIRARAIPADFHSLRPRETPHLLIPGAANLQFCQTCLYEYLAAVLGR